MKNKIEIGEVYKMSDIYVTCVGFTKKGHAKMQTHGMTAGKWPGKGDISGYDDITRVFTQEWTEIIKKFRLPTLKQVRNNKLVKDSLREAARYCSSFEADFSNAWLGTVNADDIVYFIYADGDVGNFNYLLISYVVAPQFNLDTSRIFLDGDEIKKLNADDSLSKPDTDDGLNKLLMLDMSMLHLSQDTIDKLCTDEEDLGVVAYPKTVGSENIGLFIRVDKDIVAGLEKLDNMPDDLLEIIKFAGKHGCDWINLGPDGTFINDLPMYNDED